jgi:hypothetical protein
MSVQPDCQRAIRERPSASEGKRHPAAYAARPRGGLPPAVALLTPPRSPPRGGGYRALRRVPLPRSQPGSAGRPIVGRAPQRPVTPPRGARGVPDVARGGSPSPSRAPAVPPAVPPGDIGGSPSGAGRPRHRGPARRSRVSGHPQPAREGRLKTGQRDGRVRESYAGDFPPAESKVANQISMSQKQ